MINEFTIMMALVLLLALLMRGNKAGNWKYIFFSCLLMFCLLGLRDVTKIGNDSRTSYLYSFYNASSRDIGSYFSSYSFEGNLGYRLLEKIMNTLTNRDYQLYIAIQAAFFMLVFYHFILRYSVSPVQSICYYWGLLLYLFMFSGLKQAMAMTTLLLAFDAIIDKKPIKFLILVFLASQFHFPAIIFLPAYWIAKLKPGRYFILLLLGLLLLTYIFRDQLLTVMMNAYEDETASGEYSIQGTRFFTNKAIIMFVIVIVALLVRQPDDRDRTYSIILELVSVSIVFQTFCTYSNIFERLADYYFQFSVLLIPMVFEHNVESKSLLPWRLDTIIKSIAPYLFSAYGVWRFASIVRYDDHFVPFRFFFE